MTTQQPRTGRTDQPRRTGARWPGRGRSAARVPAGPSTSQTSSVRAATQPLPSAVQPVPAATTQAFPLPATARPAIPVPSKDRYLDLDTPSWDAQPKNRPTTTRTCTVMDLINDCLPGDVIEVTTDGGYEITLVIACTFSVDNDEGNVSGLTLTSDYVGHAPSATTVWPRFQVGHSLIYWVEGFKDGSRQQSGVITGIKHTTVITFGIS